LITVFGLIAKFDWEKDFLVGRGVIWEEFWFSQD